MCFLNKPVGNFDLGGSFGQERLDITDQLFRGLSRKNNPGPSDDWTGVIVLSGKEICVGLVSGREVGTSEELIPQLSLWVNLVECVWGQKRLKPSVNSLRGLWTS